MVYVFLLIVLLPWLLGFATFRNKNLYVLGYIVMWLITFFMPFILIQIMEYLYPPDPNDFHCANVYIDIGVIFGIWIIGYPILILNQVLLFFYFKKKNKK